MVAEVGKVDEIVIKQIEGTSITKIVKDKVTPKRKLEGWEIVLIIVLAPLWVPLLIGLGGLLIGAIAVFFSLVISLWAVDLGLFVGSFEAFITVFTLLFAGEGLKALAYFGISLAMAGLGILLLLVGVKLTKYTIELAKKLINKIKTKMVLKGAKK